MKFRKIIVISVIAVLFLTGCRSLGPLIPLVQKPSMTLEQIKALEDSEYEAIQANYRQEMALDSANLTGQPTITNVFAETDIRSALVDIATQSGVNIIPDQTVSGSVTVNLNHVSLERALHMVLFSGGYSFRYIKEGNYYLVGKSLPENSSFNDLSTTRIVKTNQSAQKVFDQLSDFYKPYAQPSKEGNVLTLNGPENILNRLERDVKLIDASKRQIEISAKFIVVQWEKGYNLGMQWGDINLAATGLGNLVKGVSSAFSSNLSASLENILSTNGYKAKVNIVAEPRIVVEDGSAGELKITEEHLIMVLAGGGTAYNYFTTKEVEIGIIMKVTPQVARNGKIRLQLAPELSDIVGEEEFKTAGSNQKLPIIARRSTSTTINVDNDQTIAIGGLVMKSKKVTSQGIPILGSLPLVGKLLFGGKSKSEKNEELVIFITSKIIG